MEYEEMRAKYGFDDSERNRKHWAQFQEHRKRCKARAAERHQLFKNDREAWNRSVAGLPSKEQARLKQLELKKSDLMKKLNR